MSDYKIIHNHFIFDKTDTDWMGTYYRAGKIEQNKTRNHCTLVQLKPEVTSFPDVINLLNVMSDEIHESKIRNLLSPETIDSVEDGIIMIYPLLSGRNLDQIIKDAEKKQTVIDLDLAFSIVISIADILDTASQEEFSKIKSFHGFLTPDNIFIDYDGRVVLKNFGIFPFLRKNHLVAEQNRERFKEMLAPEFSTEDILLPQSDVYHLGNIVYRLLCGNYFPLGVEKSFEAKIKDIPNELLTLLPEDEPDFEKNIIEFFSKTLNPDPKKRFSTMKEMKDHIGQFFHVSEVSTGTFIIAYFMNLLYMDTIEKEDSAIKKEAVYEKPIPVEPVKVIEQPVASPLPLEEIHPLIQEKKSSGFKIFGAVAAIIIAIVGAVAFWYVTQQGKNETQLKRDMKSAQDLKEAMARMTAQLDEEYRKRLDAIEKKTAQTLEEKKARDSEIMKLKEWKTQQEKIQSAQIKDQKTTTQPQTQPTQQPQQQKDTTVQTPPQTIDKSKTTPQTAPVTPSGTTVSQDPKKDPAVTTKTENKPDVVNVKAGDLVPLEVITKKPNKFSGKSNFNATELNFPEKILKLYSKQKISIQVTILLDQNGFVRDIKYPEYLMDEMRPPISSVLKSWEYSPAEKDKIRVKVWIPASISITFN